MQLHQLKPAAGSRRRRKIIGRGRGSGHGKTSGKGHKGQKARSGRSILRSLEGGQMPIIRRLPKVGFRSKRPIFYKVVTLESLSRFREGVVVSAQALKDKGLIKNVFRPYKILGTGELKKALTIEAYAFSRTALDMIAKAGGTTRTVDRKLIKASQQKEQK